MKLLQVRDPLTELDFKAHRSTCCRDCLGGRESISSESFEDYVLLKFHPKK